MIYMPIVKYISANLKTNVWLWSDGEIKTLSSTLEGFTGTSGDDVNRQSGAPDTSAMPDEIFTLDRSFLQYLIDEASGECPVCTFIGEHLFMVHFASPQGVFIIGPMKFTFSDNSSPALHRREVRNIPADYISQTEAVLPPQSVRSTLMLFNALNETDLSESECYHRNFKMEDMAITTHRQTTKDLFVNRENRKMHTPYEQEMRIRRCIENGDPEALPGIWSEPVSGSLGLTASDPVRNGKNLSITNIVLSSRAAISGGVPPEEALTLADTYIRQIEDLTNMMVLQPLIEDMQVTFARLVAERKNAAAVEGDENRIVQQCKTYISQHLHDTLTVRDIADAIGVHPNYLSSLFHRTEGVPLYRYIQKQKIYLAKNLLRYSNYTYLEIANYLGFSSQSHLGQLFKKETGVTLKQYRDRNKPHTDTE